MMKNGSNGLENGLNGHNLVKSNYFALKRSGAI